MRFGITDEYGDEIVVSPMPPNGIFPRVLIRFVDNQGDAVDMVLSDRTGLEIKRAITQSLKQSEVLG